MIIFLSRSVLCVSRKLPVLGLDVGVGLHTTLSLWRCQSVSINTGTLGIWTGFLCQDSAAVGSSAHFLLIG